MELRISAVNPDTEPEEYAWEVLDEDGEVVAASTPKTYPTPGAASDAAYALISPQAFAEPDPR